MEERIRIEIGIRIMKPRKTLDSSTRGSELNIPCAVFQKLPPGNQGAGFLPGALAAGASLAGKAAVS